MRTTMAVMPELRQDIERAGQKTVFLEGPENETNYVNPKGKAWVRLLAQLVAERVDRSPHKSVIFTLPPRDQFLPVDRMPKERQTMAIAEKPPLITIDQELQAAVDRVLRGVRDPDAMRQAANRMDRMREEMRHRVGNVNLAVPLIRTLRHPLFIGAGRLCGPEIST